MFQDRGQTLMELLLALGIFAFIMTAVFSLVFGGMTTGLRTEEQDFAAMFAQEGLDAARSIRDRDWGTFISANDAPNTHGVLNSGSGWAWGGDNGGTNNETTEGARKYTREIIVENVGRVDTNGDSIPDDIFTGVNSTNLDFDSSAGYTFDSTKIEFANNAAKLKLQTSVLAGTEANLKALYHFNSTSGAEANREGDELDIGAAGDTTDDDLGGVSETNLKGLWHLNDAALETGFPPVSTFSNAGGGNWPSRSLINIKGSTALLTNYQILVTIDTASLIAAGKMKSDGSDIRFANATDGELSYWIESGINTTATKIWVNIDSVPASPVITAIYMYYGNPSAASFSGLDLTIGATSGNPGNSCLQIKVNNLSATSGTYWLKPASTAFQAYCDMTTDGKVWTKIDSNFAAISVNKGTASWSGTNVAGTGLGTGCGVNLVQYTLTPSNITYSEGYSLLTRTTSILQCSGINASDGSVSVSANGYYTPAYNGTLTSNSMCTWNDGKWANATNTNMTGLKLNWVTKFNSTNPSAPLRYITQCSDSSDNGAFTMQWFTRRGQNLSTDPQIITVDSSGNNNNGSLYNGVLFPTAGKFSNALSFNGGNYVNAGTNSVLDFTAGDFTFEAWINPSNVTGWKGILGKYNWSTGGYIFALSNGQPAFWRNGVWYYGTAASVSASQWQHLAVKLASGTLTFYVNGVAQTPVAAGSPLISAAQFQIGAGGSNWYPFNGSIDEVAVYNTALGAPAVLDHYRRGVAEDATINETAGNTFGPNDGNIYSAITTAGNTGLNQALQFDGVDDFVNTPNNIDLSATNAASVEFWAKIPSYPSSEKILIEMSNNAASRTDSFSVYIGDTANNANIGIFLRGNGSNNAGYSIANYDKTIVNDGAWHHWAAIFDTNQPDNNEVNLYIDGTLRTPTQRPYTSNNTNNFGNQPFYFASRGGSSSFANVILDEVAIWNTALPADTIAAHATTIIGYPSSAEITTPAAGILSDLGSFKDFTETAVLPSGTFIDYSISTDSCYVMQYWDGNDWSTTGGWNDARTINRYFSFLGAGSKNFCLKARLNTTDPNQTPLLDNIKINYNQIGGTDDIHTKKITSRVKWNNSLALQDISLSEYLTDWNYNSWTQTTYNDFYCPLCSAENPQYLGSANPDDAASGGISLTPQPLPPPLFMAVRYTSAAYDTGSSQKLLKLVWNEDTPIGTEIHFYLCTSQNSGLCGDYMGPGGTNFGTDYFSNSSSACSKSGTTVTCLILSNIGIGDGVNDRYITYVLDLMPNGSFDQAPTLYDVSVQYKEIY